MSDPIDRPQRGAPAGGGDGALSWRVRLRMRVRSMSPRALSLNLALAMLLIGAVAAAVLTIVTPDEPAQVARTATVTRGTVTARVTGSGNAISSLSTPVNFADSGVVTAINVKPGDTVQAGDVLATIDRAGAEADLRIAQAGLDSALAAYRHATAGPSDVAKQQDQLAIEQARQEVANAEAAVRKAEKQLELDKAAAETAIDNAKDKLELDEEAQDTAVENAQDALDACRRGSSSSTSSEDCSAEEQALTTAEQTRESVLEADRQAITTAEQQRKNTLLQSSFAVETATQGVIAAQNQVKAAELTAEGNLTPQTPDQIAQAKAAADTAQVEVEMAQRAVDQTELEAPQAGVVLAVNGRVGETTGPNGSNGDSSESDEESSSSGTSPSSSDSSDSGSGTTEFISVANPSQLAVESDIAEADAAKIELGRRVDVTFPATGATATGSVTQKTPQSTEENNVVFYPVTVSLDTAPPDVGVGATANLSVSAGSVDNVLMVPSAAITTVGNNHTVTVRRIGVDSVVPVEVGLRGDSTTEITGGLAEGDVVVLPSSTAPQGGGGGLPPRGGGGR